MQLFIGKGGVGKTTLACADAVAAAGSGARVLLASVDQAHSLGDVLGFRFPHDPGTVAAISTVAPGLDVIELDSLALLEEKFGELTATLTHGGGHRHSLFGSSGEHGIDITALDPAELTGLPGVQELLVLVEIAQYAADADWDVIVVDCPPSADMVRLLAAPETLLNYLDRVWPPHARALSGAGTDVRAAVLAVTVQRIVAAVTDVRDLLADHRRTGVTVVTVAERVAVAESARVRSAAALFGLRMDAVLVNKLLPEPDSAATVRAPENSVVRWYLERRAEQLAILAQLREQWAGVRVLATEHTGHAPVGPASLRALTYREVSADSSAEANVGAYSRHQDGGENAAGSSSAPAARALMLGANRTETDRTQRVRQPEDRAGDTPDSGQPQVRWESGTGTSSVYTLRMRLPVVDATTLRLGRVEDDLIVGADGVRRRVRLAPVLRRCTVDGAELGAGHLLVRFRPDPNSWPESSEGHGYGQ